MRRPAHSAATAAGLVLLLAACLPTATTEHNELERNRARWDSRAPAAYEFVFRRSCECLPEQTALMRVTVRGGEVESVVDVQSGEEVSPATYRPMTIDQIFAEIEKALNSRAHLVEVSYDPELGYPAAVFIDHHETMVDDEFSYTASELRSAR